MRNVSTVSLILWTLLWSELAIVGYYTIRSSVYRRTTHIITTAKSSVTVSESGTLAHFFEPIANSLGQNSQPPWLTTKPVYTINADTLHDSKNYSHDKPSGTYRIITLGDSFTYGLFVDTDENWTELLETKLNSKKPCASASAYEVLNLGMTGYDVAHSVERMRVRGAKYSPDLVIWFLKQDDFDEISDYGIPKAEAYLRSIQKSSGIFDSRTGDVITKQIRDELGIPYIVRYQTDALNNIRRSYTGKLLLYSTPDVFKSSFIDNERIIADFLANDTDALLYISPIDLSKAAAIFPDHHPNQIGHTRIADDLYSYITQNTIIACTHTD